MLQDAAAEPATARRSARRHASAPQRDDSAARQADDALAAHGDVAAGGHEAGPGDQIDRFVDRHRLDDAVEVELRAGGPKDDSAEKAHRTPRADDRVADRPRVIFELDEV